MILVFDTETTGLPPKNSDPIKEYTKWPRLVQLAWKTITPDGEVDISELIYPNGYIIPPEATAVHGITTDYAKQNGKPLEDILKQFLLDTHQADLIIGHNLDYDSNVITAEMTRLGFSSTVFDCSSIDTMKVSVNLCKIPNRYGYKFPKLDELYVYLFSKSFDGAHNAMVDVNATYDCYKELKRLNIVSA